MRRPGASDLQFGSSAYRNGSVRLTRAALPELGVPDEAAAGAAVALIAPYAAIALRRAYPQSIPWILLKSAAMIALTLTFNPRR
jgi:hypothetical protein